MRHRPGRFWRGAAIAILCIMALAFWQWRNVARVIIVTAADSLAGVNVTLGHMTLGSKAVVFDDVRVTSKRDEPIATIPRLAIAYDLGDWLRGTRLFGLRAIDAYSPHV